MLSKSQRFKLCVNQSELHHGILIRINLARSKFFKLLQLPYNNHSSTKYFPGLGRRQSSKKIIMRASSSMSHVDQTDLFETIVSLLPKKRGRSFCKFMLCLLRLAFLLGVDGSSVKKLERKTWM
ncbi:hypothetical protein YC2023_037404 [Brassica napus]